MVRPLLVWAAANSAVNYINNGGNVGIGTTSPYSKLSVWGSGNLLELADTSSTTVFLVNASGDLAMTGTTTMGALPTRTTPGPPFRSCTSTPRGVMHWTATSTWNTGWTGLGDIALTDGYLIAGNAAGAASATSSIFIQGATGNVGIGTTSPLSTLSLQGTAGTPLLNIASSTGATVLGVTEYDQITLGGIDYTWPGSQSGNYFLKTDGSGQLSWAQASGGIYYGEPGSLAFYKDAGIMATGTTGNLLYWDDTNARLGIGTTSPWGHLSVEGQGTYPELVVTGADMVPDLVIDANGRLGLGTANPAYLFDLTGSSTDYLARIYNTNTGTTSSGLYIRSDGTSGNLLTLNAGGSDIFTVSQAASVFNNPVTFGSAGDVSIANDLLMTNTTAGDIIFKGPGVIKTKSSYQNLNLTLSAANAGKVVVDDELSVAGTSTIANTLYANYYTGNVGIGTSSPQTTFAIEGTAGTNPFSIASSTGATILGVYENGNVGIGTSSPWKELSVNGTGVFSDGLCIGSDCKTDWASVGPIDVSGTPNLGEITYWVDSDTVGATTTLNDNLIADDITLTNITQISNRAITDTTANNWKMFYSNGSGNVSELSLGSTAGYILMTTGGSAPLPGSRPRLSLRTPTLAPTAS